MNVAIAIALVDL